MKIEKVVNVYLLFVLGIYPLVIHDGYLDIVKTKSNVFIWATAILWVLTIVLSILKDDFKQLIKKKNWLIYIFAFIIWINTKCAWNYYAALTGNEGRRHGAIVFWAYCLAGICIINYGKFKRYYLDVLIGTGTITSLIAILNFYEIDILGIISQIATYQRHIFISTIGNINFFAAYLSIIIPVAIIKAINEQNVVRRRIYYFAVMCLYGAAMASMSDSVYITLLVIGGALPFYCLPHKARRIRMFIILLLFSVVLLGGNILNKCLVYPLSYLDGILIDFSDIRLCILVFIISLMLIIISKFGERYMERITPKQWSIGWSCIGGLILCLVSIWYICNTNFDGSWGNNRGAIWAQSLEFYLKQSSVQKIIGIGLDSIYPVFYEFFGYEALVSGKKEVYDSIHNEYLQYLITTGIVGLTAYLTAMGVMLYRLFHKAKQNETAFAIGMAGVCYMAQAFVNISMSSVMAIIMILLLIGQVIEE